MKVEERKKLLDDTATLTHVEAENVSDLKKVFLALPSHRLALRKDVVVVLGARGAGKSALFLLLDHVKKQASLERVFGKEIPDATWVDAFSQLQLRHPDVSSLDEFAARASDSALRGFWLSHLLVRLSEHLGITDPDLPDPFTPEAERAIPKLNAKLDDLERYLASRDRIVFATYDHLDRIGSFDRHIRRRYVSALLAQWLSLSNRYRHLRAKIFLREDLFADAASGFPDASKLRPRSVTLEWNVASLYRTVVRYLASKGKRMRDWLSEVEGLRLENWGDLGYMPSEMSEPVQKAFAVRLAGELMGSGIAKGYTYRWIPNRLQDANLRIVPRSILNLFGYAAREALHRPLPSGDRLLAPSDLRAALEPTSRARVIEVGEEYPPVRRLANLRGRHVLIERDDVIRLLAKPLSDEPPFAPTDGELVFDELTRLGVLRVRDDRHGRGRVDVPDIYRFGYGILRKGGVARPK